MLPLVAIGMGRSWSEMTAFLMLDVFKRKTLGGGGFIVIITLGYFYRGGGNIKVIFLKKDVWCLYEQTRHHLRLSAETLTSTKHASL